MTVEIGVRGEGGGERIRPVLAWAVVGACFAALGVYIFVSWFTSGEAVRTATGLDAVPTTTKFWVRFFEVVSVSAGIASVVHSVRSSLRQGRLSFDAMLTIGFFSALWQDPMLNYVRPTFFYNAYMVNLGSWSERIPGWVSPNGAKLPEPIIFVAGAYLWMMAVAALFCFGVGKAKARWPSWGPVRLFALGFVTLAMFDGLIEIVFLRTEVFAYPGAIHGLSFAGGRPFQFPLYETIVASGLWSAAGALRYWRDDTGRSWVERGIDRVAVSTRVRLALQTLAVVGFINATLLVVYMIPYNWFSLHVDKAPEYPSYLRAGICGAGTGYDCPDPTKPIPLPLVPPARR